MKFFLCFLFIQFFIICCADGFMLNYCKDYPKHEARHASKMAHEILSPNLQKESSTNIRKLYESDIFPLTRMLVQEWGPLGPSPLFTLFPKFISKRFTFTSFIDNFCLAIVITLGLYQRWNRKGFLSHDDYIVLVILNSRDEVLGAAELSWQPKDQVATPLALPFGFKRLLAGGSEKMVPYISNVVVSRKHRKQGYGRKLIQACEDKLRKMETSHSICVYLHVSNKKECTAKNWYMDKLGYEMADNQNETKYVSLVYEWSQRVILLLGGLYFMERPSLDYLKKQLRK
mmetsp:Transcript_1771/g.2695  ORF Transcript_1771/g.2695 Transcript_1771/m.2695 type:complete len:287 (-) Transcript_1771:27-887(-)